MGMPLGHRKPMSAAAIEANRINGRKGGRPKMAYWSKNKVITAKAFRYCSEAIEVLVHEMRHSDNPTIRVQCCRELLDRGVGRSTNHMESNHTGGALLNQLVVYTGVPEPEPGPQEEQEILIGEESEPVEDEDRFEIEGEVVKD